MKNMEKSTVLKIAEQVEYSDGQVVSKTLQQNAAVSITLFAFDEGEEISTHAAGGDALVVCLDGQGRITVDGEPHTLTAGDCIIMPAGHPHAVFAEKRFKMLLTVAF